MLRHSSSIYLQGCNNLLPSGTIREILFGVPYNYTAVYMLLYGQKQNRELQELGGTAGGDVSDEGQQMPQRGVSKLMNFGCSRFGFQRFGS